MGLKKDRSLSSSFFIQQHDRSLAAASREKSFMKKLLMSLAIVMLASMAAQAGITVNTIPGITYTTTAIDHYSTTTAMMNGMQVTAVWGIFTETQTWNSGVDFITGGFGLHLDGDSYSSDAWKLSIGGSALLNRLTLNGIPGNTVFDLTFGGATGTPDSQRGKTFDSDDFSTDVTVTYSNLLQLGSGPPVEDLYTDVTIDFGSGIGPGDYYFSMDTDNATTRIVPTPEPSSLILFGTGLAGLAIAFRRRHDL